MTDAERAAALIEAVRSHFPDLTWSTCRYLGHGWDHDILVLDERLVMRAPKSDSYRCEFGHEIALMEHLSHVVEVSIPHYTLVAPDGSLAGYELLKGQELRRELFATLGAGERALLARELGKLLTALHAIPRAGLEPYHLRTEDEAALCRDLVPRVQALLYPRLCSRDRSTIARYLDRLGSIAESQYEPVLIHCDLTQDHILWDATAGRVSVIDFSDRACGDPARDFAGLFEYGIDFVRAVAAGYTGQTAGLLERAELYYQRISIWLMLDALEGLPCSFDDGYRLFRRCFGAPDTCD